MQNKNIPVTKPFLPPKKEYDMIISKIWNSHWLTNMGEMSTCLEKKLKKHLETTNLLYVSSGTMALQLAIKSLKLSGEIITTPFSFVATTSSIVWEGCKPVFCDIDPNSLNIDPSKIESLITPKTSAIIATHVFGNPCDVIAIGKIAKKHNLKIIYDGAHAFGVTLKEKSVFEYGDISICSLHATKLYHSIEGGFLVTKSNKTHKKLEFMRNFGFDGPEKFAVLGINAKNSEFHAAMGLLNLNHLDSIIEKRKKLSECYDKNILETKSVRKVDWHPDATYSYSYYPIIFKNETLLLKSIKELENNNVYPRRYFYPSLSKSLPYVSRKSLEVTDVLANKVLCLPLYYELQLEQVEFVCKILKETLNKSCYKDVS